MTIVLTQLNVLHVHDVGLAIIGSYLIMRGVGLFLDYSYEFSIFYEYHRFYTMPKVDPYTYIYIGGFFVVTILSSLIKLKIKMVNMRKNLHPYYLIN